MNFDEAVSYLYSLINYEYKPGYVDSLEPYRDFLIRVGEPQKFLKSPILVVGTKGKGSTASLIASALMSNGYRVGLYTSPHLVDIRERIRLNFSMIPEEKFAMYVATLKPFVRSNGVRTYFEILTTIAFMYFLDENTDFVVLEAGLGGRLDATNVVDQIATVITPIDLDHTRILGDTIEKIAIEKAAVIKSSSPVITYQYHSEALRVVEERSKKLHAPLHVVKSPVILSLSEDGTKIMINGNTIFSPLVGRFQAVNMATAFETVKVLGFEKIDFSKVELKGRFDIVRQNSTTIVIDSAHNKVSLKEFFNSYFEIFSEKPYVIFGVSKDKDIEEMLKILKNNVDNVILTGSSVPRTIDPELLYDISVKIGIYVMGVYKNPCDALRFLTMDKKSRVILIIGSFYVAGDVYKCL